MSNGIDRSECGTNLYGQGSLAHSSISQHHQFVQSHLSSHGGAGPRWQSSMCLTTCSTAGCGCNFSRCSDGSMSKARRAMAKNDRKSSRIGRSCVCRAEKATENFAVGPDDRHPGRLAMALWIVCGDLQEVFESFVWRLFLRHVLLTPARQ